MNRELDFALVLYLNLSSRSSFLGNTKKIIKYSVVENLKILVCPVHNRPSNYINQIKFYDH